MKVVSDKSYPALEQSVDEAACTPPGQTHSTPGPVKQYPPKS